jgi:GntR family transcriptional regulator
VEERFFNKLETFDNEMRAKGFKPHTETLSLEKVTYCHEAHEKLGLSAEEPLLCLRRLRFIDDTPIVHLETFLQFSPYDKLMNVDFNTESLYDSLEKFYGVRIKFAHREIEAVNASKKDANLLKIPVNKALSLVKTLGYTSREKPPVEFSIARYRGDMNKFSVDVTR